jgi:hypothetical protein
MEFKQFVESQESDIEATLAKIPKKHKALVKGYKFKFQDGNTLKGDDGHVGITDEDNKTITICAPWVYARQFTTLHEIAHLLWKQMTPKLKKEWELLIKQTKMKKQDRQNAEELFCMAYGATYTKHPPLTYCHKKWIKFIKKLQNF